MKYFKILGFCVLFTLFSHAIADNEDVASNPAYSLYASKDLKTIDVYLGDEIGPSAYYSYLEVLLSKATSDQTFIFHIAGYGGSTDTGVQLMHYIKNTKAHTIMRIEAPSYSMHALLVCAGKQIEALPGTYLMFHDYSFQYSGKANEAMKFLVASNEQVREVMTSYCQTKKVLTAQEIDAIMVSGTDVYLSDKEINKRLSH